MCDNNIDMFTYEKSFCALPWSHIFINERGEFYPCCFSHDGESAFTEKEGGRRVLASDNNSLKKIWNGNDLKNIRKMMLNNSWPKMCQICFDTEKLNTISHRQYANRRYAGAFSEALEKTSPDGYYDGDIKSFDIRPGNLCNLACRMCSPLSTKKIIPEYRKISKDEHAYISEENIDWFEAEHFWIDLSDNFKHVKIFHMAGGEPLIIKKLRDFLQKLIDIGVSESVTLTYNTNLTVIPDVFYEIWPKFKKIRITISLDGVGKINDYIRYPSKWDVMEQNLAQIERDWDKLNIEFSSIHAVVQAYNVTRVVDLCKFCQRFSKISRYPIFDFVSSNDFCDVRLLPSNIKKLAKQNIEEYLPILRDILDDAYYDEEKLNLENQLNSIVEFMYSEDRPDLIHKFKWNTEIFDRHRGQRLKDFVPELAELMN